MAPAGNPIRDADLAPYWAIALHVILIAPMIRRSSSDASTGARAGARGFLATLAPAIPTDFDPILAGITIDPGTTVLTFTSGFFHAFAFSGEDR
jgi:hypothetical protein